MRCPRPRWKIRAPRLEHPIGLEGLCGRTGLKGAGREPVRLLPRQLCPTDARVLVCYRHHRPIVAPLPDQALDPTTPGV